MDQSGTVRQRQLKNRSKPAEVVVDKALSRSAIYGESLGAIEERVKDLRSRKGGWSARGMGKTAGGVVR